MISDHDITSTERGGVGRQAGYPLMSLHAGGRFTGYQQSRGNKCDVEVILKVCSICFWCASNSYFKPSK